MPSDRHWSNTTVERQKLTNRRTVLRTIGTAVVGGAGVASAPALAKKGGSGVFGFGTFYAGESFSLRAWEDIEGFPARVEDAASCMYRDSAQKSYKPFAVSYESGKSSDEEPLRFLAIPERQANSLDTTETYEFVSRTLCKGESDVPFWLVAFRRRT